VRLRRFTVFGSDFVFELGGGKGSAAILFGVPGSGKSHLLGLVAAPLLAVEQMLEVGMEPSRALETVLTHLFPRYRSLIRGDTSVSVELDIDGYEIRFTIDRSAIPRMDIPFKGLRRYMQKQPPPFIYLDEYRVHRFRQLIRDGAAPRENPVSNHLYRWVEYVAKLQRESHPLAGVFDTCSYDMLSTIGFSSARPIDLAERLTEFNTSLIHESYTVLNLATLSMACLALCLDKPHLVIIDMPEHGLLPGTLRGVALAITRCLAQGKREKLLLIATHSPLLAALIIRRAGEWGAIDAVKVYEMYLEMKEGARYAKIRSLETGKAPRYLLAALQEIAKEVA